MAEQGAELWNPMAQTRMVFTTPASCGDGTLLEVDWFVAPGHGLPTGEHVHKGPDGHIGERFHIFAGTCTMSVDGKSIDGKAGDIIDVPCNAAHIHPVNTGQEELHVRQVITPDVPRLEMLTKVEKYFETVCALSQQGKADENGNIGNKLQSALSAAELLLPDTYPTGFPVALLDVIFFGPAITARLAGYSAYVQPDWTLRPV